MELSPLPPTPALGLENLPLQVLSGLSFGQIDMFNRFLVDTYLRFPSLSKPENSKLLLLAYAIMPHVADCSRQLEVLHEWAGSEDGRSLYDHLARDAQGSQNVEQLALITVAMMSFSRLLPSFADDLYQPIKSSYLADLDAYLTGQLLGNSARVAERMMFALLRVLSTLGDQYQDLIAFLTTTINRGPLLLHHFDGLSDQYVKCRINGQTHRVALQTVMEEMPYFKQELGEQRKVTQSDLQMDQYRLTRLSKVEHEDVSKWFDSIAWALYGVLSVLPLGDGSYEIVVQDSHCTSLNERLGNILPGSKFDLNYNPLEPTDEDLLYWDCDTAKELHRDWFAQRTTRMAEDGRLDAATTAYYTYLLEHYCLETAATESYSREPVPTFRGFLESKNEAICLVEACLRGVVAHSHGPGGGKAIVSGDIYVWERNSTRIDYWNDGMQWTTQECGVFKVCESITAPGLMKKTISIPACRTVHHVVSYYRVQDVESLARPSWCMIYAP